jgi:hypothetical protein
MTRDRDGDGVADDQGDADLAGREQDQADVETDDDPQGMKGQLDDSMNGLEPDDDVGEASRGIAQG